MPNIDILRYYTMKRLNFKGFSKNSLKFKKDTPKKVVPSTFFQCIHALYISAQNVFCFRVFLQLPAFS